MAIVNHNMFIKGAYFFLERIEVHYYTLAEGWLGVCSNTRKEKERKERKHATFF